MKKIILPLILIVLLVISIILNVLLIYFLRRIQTPKPQEYVYGEFTMSDYAWGTSAFPIDENVGAIVDKEDAAQKGINLWVKYLTINEENVQYDPVNGEQIVVAYDEKADCWLIMGTLPPETLGAVPTSIIQANGDVVAVWMN